MIIIRFQGGLGNQLFQYALYESLKQKGMEVKADISDYASGREKRDLELGKLGLEIEVASKTELHQYYADNTKILDRIVRYLWGKKKYIKEKNDQFKPEIFKLEEGYLSGYWQSAKYFIESKDIILGKITFSNIEVEEIKKIAEKMENENSVSIHIRLGDYLEENSIYGHICTKEYYIKAISYILENVENPVFYVFSDEPQKAIQMLNLEKYYVVTENEGENSYKDMYLMSICKHNIIANSTFSWWGAWLGQAKGKIVITPSKWNQLCKASEICVEGWITV